MAQLDLFGATKQRALPPPDAQWLKLAERVPKHVHFGTSSWTFRGWQGLVYRSQYRSDTAFTRDSLYEYARFPLFKTAGIDRTFYSPLDEVTLRTYASQLPDGFRCVSKVWDEITTLVFPSHPKYGERAGLLNTNFLDPARFKAAVSDPYEAAFLPHSGPFVLEIPPSLALPDVGYFERRLERFLQESSNKFHYAVELREPRLMTDNYFAILRAHGAGHCFNFWARMPSIKEQLAVHGRQFGKVCVARLMLPHKADYEALKKAYAPFDKLVETQPEMRRDVTDLVEATARHDSDTYILVNNKAEGSAPLTIAALASLI